MIYVCTIIKYGNLVMLVLCKIKKTRPAGVRQPPGIILRRPSHTGLLENPRTPAPPIHNGTIAHVRNDRDRG
jgi:hypothetical protein